MTDDTGKMLTEDERREIEATAAIDCGMTRRMFVAVLASDRAREAEMQVLRNERDNWRAEAVERRHGIDPDIHADALARAEAAEKRVEAAERMFRGCCEANEGLNKRVKELEAEIERGDRFFDRALGVER